MRDFAAGDQAPLRELILAGLEERWGEIFDASFNPDLDDFAANYLARDAEIVVVDWIEPASIGQRGHEDLAGQLIGAVAATTAVEERPDRCVVLVEDRREVLGLQGRRALIQAVAGVHARTFAAPKVKFPGSSYGR